MSNQPLRVTVPIAPPSRRSRHQLEHSTSASEEEEDSAGRSGVDIYPEYSDQDEGSAEEDQTVNPSESASRLSSAPKSHHLIDKRRRPSQIDPTHLQRRSQHLTRARQQPHYSPPESEVGSHEDIAYDGSGGYPPGRQRPSSFYPPQQGHPSHLYGQGYAHHNGGYGQYPSQPHQPPGQQLTRMQNGFGGPQNPYGAGPVQSPYYQGPYGAHHPAYPGTHPGAHPGIPPQMSHHPGSGYGTPDMMHPQSSQYMQPGMSAQGYFPQPFTPHPLQSFMQPPHPVIQYVPVAASPPPAQSQPQAPSSSSNTPAPEAATSAPAPARTPAPAPEPAKNDGYEELKQMLIKEREEREAREAAAKKAEEDRIAKAEADKKRAEEIAAAEQRAAAAAKNEAEKKAAEEREAAAKKAAEEAAKIKEEAEEAMKKAAEEAAKNAAKAKEEHEAALAAAIAPPADRPKPIRFKDAVGRKFNFPFHLCQTWEGMEDLIKQAFLHVDVIGQHVADGHYDLIGPNNEIILPAVWETVIEPDWAITMHMWPLPEPEPEAPSEPDPENDPGPAVAGDASKHDGKDGTKKGKARALPKSKGKAASSSPPLPIGVEVLDGPQPPPPPPAPSGSIADGPTASGTKPTKKKPAGWGIFGGGPRPKSKTAKPAPPGPKKPA